MIKPAILHLPYNPSLAFASTYAQQPSLGCTSAHHIHARMETPDFFFHPDSRVFFSFSFSNTKSTRILPRNRKTCCSYGMLSSQEITVNPYTSWRIYAVVGFILVPIRNENQGAISQNAGRLKSETIPTLKRLGLHLSFSCRKWWSFLWRNMKVTYPIPSCTYGNFMKAYYWCPLTHAWPLTTATTHCSSSQQLSEMICKYSLFCMTSQPSFAVW